MRLQRPRCVGSCARDFRPPRAARRP